MEPSEEPDTAPRAPAVSRWERRSCRVLLALAVVLRLGFLLAEGSHDRFDGGDGPWYVRQGWLIVHGALPAPLSTVGPLYPLLLGAVWLLVPGASDPVGAAVVPAAYLTAVRVVQIALGVLTVWLGYALTRHLAGAPRAALVVALALGAGPAFVMEPFGILTETTFMALLTLGIWAYVRGHRMPGVRTGALAGLALALAALTRPVLLLFPLVLVPHLLVLHGIRIGGRSSAVLLGVFTLVVLPWSVYLYHGTGRWLPEGFQSNLWIGAMGDGKWPGRDALDDLRQRFPGGVDDYATEAARLIGSDPARWIRLRARNLGEAVVQPHGTVDLRGPGIWQASTDSHGQRGLLGRALKMVATPGFWPKLSIYLLHGMALVFGAVGALVSLRHWRQWYAVYAVIAYFPVAYGMLTIAPRYLFPAEVFVWVLAGIGLSWAWDRLGPPAARRSAREEHWSCASVS